LSITVDGYRITVG